MILHESAEMYLETIHVLNQKQDLVRAVDIANHMGYSKPTISEWMGKLSRGGYVEVAGNGHITLTQEGLSIAEKIYNRHITLENLFITLGVNPEIAEEDACRVEHYISDETFEALRTHYEAIQTKKQPG